MSAYTTLNRVRTETRTAFCPICLVRLSLREVTPGRQLDFSPTYGAVACKAGVWATPGAGVGAQPSLVGGAR